MPFPRPDVQPERKNPENERRISLRSGCTPGLGSSVAFHCAQAKVVNR